MFFAKDNKKQQKEIKAKIAANQQLYHQVFDTPEGQKVLEDLAKRCFEHSSTFDDNTSRMCFNEGRRSVYKHIQNLLGKELTEILEELTIGGE